MTYEEKSLMTDIRTTACLIVDDNIYVDVVNSILLREEENSGIYVYINKDCLLFIDHRELRKYDVRHAYVYSIVEPAELICKMKYAGL